MLKFVINDMVRELIRQHHREVQATIAVKANTVIGHKFACPEGIANPQGGVVVNGKQIAFGKNVVHDAFSPNTKYGTKEEWIALAALHETIHILKTDPSRLERPKPDLWASDPLRELAGI